MERFFLKLTEKGFETNTCPSVFCRNSDLSQTYQMSWHTKHQSRSKTLNVDHKDALPLSWNPKMTKLKDEDEEKDEVVHTPVQHSS